MTVAPGLLLAQGIDLFKHQKYRESEKVLLEYLSQVPHHYQVQSTQLG